MAPMDTKHDLRTSAPAGAQPRQSSAPGLEFQRFFTKPGVSPYDEVEWELRTASITATNIVASKYLHGTIGTPERETGVRQLIARVAESIRDWGLAQGYFRTPE